MALAPSEVFFWYMIFTTETQDLIFLENDL